MHNEMFNQVAKILNEEASKEKDQKLIELLMNENKELKEQIKKLNEDI